MGSVMTKHERVRAALSGDEVDRVPVSAWGHDFLREWSAEGLAEATVEAYRRYDWDFIKVNPRASYNVEPWGTVYEPSGNPDESPRLAHSALRSATDLERIQPVDITSGPFGEQLDALAIIAQAVGDEVPILQTLFSPLAVVRRLCGSAQFVQEMMKMAPQRLERALSSIAESQKAYVSLCLKRGVAGIFFATVEWGSRNEASKNQYERFARPFDLDVLAEAKEGYFNVLHVCRDDNRLMDLLDYPVHAFSWATPSPEGGLGNPTLREILDLTDRAAMGGAAHGDAMVSMSPEAVADMGEKAASETGGRRFLLAPGCSLPPSVPDQNVRALREAAEGTR